MSKKVTRTDVMYRVIMPGDVVQDCATMKEALEWTKNGGAYQGEVTVLREMSIEDWLSHSTVVEKKKEDK